MLKKRKIPCRLCAILLTLLFGCRTADAPPQSLDLPDPTPPVTGASMGGPLTEDTSAALSYCVENEFLGPEGDPEAALQFVQVLAVACRIHSRLSGQPLPPFDTWPWYQGCMDYALANGLLDKAPWKPEDTITRADMAKLFTRLGADNSSRLTLDHLRDTDDADMLTLARAGVLRAADRWGNFRPFWAVSRGETAITVQRLLQPQTRLTTPPPIDSPVVNAQGDTLDTLSVYLDGQHLPFSQILFDKGRYYLPEDGQWLSLFDLCSRDGLLADFQHENRSIHLYSGYTPPTPSLQATDGTPPALIRFEDVTALDGPYLEPDTYLRLRVMFDFLYGRNIPYSIAWVPRFVVPEAGIDNDLETAYSLPNADLVYTLDFAQQRGGEIGLHGYTHQSGNQASLEGFEFIKGMTAEQARERMESAVRAAHTLDIPYTFFEFPHYSARLSHYKEAEKLFDIIYHWPYLHRLRHTYNVKVGDRVVRYVGTPLDYVKNPYAVDEMLEKIEKFGQKGVAALFFHPYLERPYVTVTRDWQSAPAVTYDEQSPLHRVVDTMESTGRQFVSLENLPD